MPRIADAVLDNPDSSIMVPQIEDDAWRLSQPYCSNAINRSRYLGNSL
jgi:hypothetical protein